MKIYKDDVERLERQFSETCHNNVAGNASTLQALLVIAIRLLIMLAYNRAKD